MKPIIALSMVVTLIGCGNNSGSEITETGTLEATEVMVSALAGGTVQALLVEEGSLVRAGDTLAILDATDWRYQLQQAEANLRAVEAVYKLAREGPRQEDVIQAEANFRSAQNDLKRMEELFASKSVSEKQLEDTRTRHTLAEQTWEKMKRGSREEEIELAKARRDQAFAQLASLRKKVNDCVITSPLGGTVTKKFVERGELVGQGMSVVRVSDLSRLTLTIYVGEAFLPRIQLGQKASVKVDAFNERSFEGEVIFTSPTAEFTPKNIQTKDERIKLVFGVKIRVANPDGTLKGGVPADATLTLTGEEG